jgi:hypothetical protein
MPVDIHIESLEEGHGISIILIIYVQTVVDVIHLEEGLTIADSVCFFVWIYNFQESPDKYELRISEGVAYNHEPHFMSNSMR